MHKIIKLNRGYEAFVDEEDYERLMPYTWNVKIDKSANSERIYVYNKSRMGNKQISIYMHRVVMDCPRGFHVDHVNHNCLDNRKENLRIVPQSLNSQNQRDVRPRKCKYRGVVKRKDCNRTKPYMAKTKVNNRNIVIGSYATEEEAGAAYADMKEKILRSYQ